MSKRYTILGTLTITVRTEVDADSEQEALGIAESRDVQTIPAVARGNPTTSWVIPTDVSGDVIHNLEIEED